LVTSLLGRSEGKSASIGVSLSTGRMVGIPLSKVVPSYCLYFTNTGPVISYTPELCGSIGPTCLARGTSSAETDLKDSDSKCDPRCSWRAEEEAIDVAGP